MLSLSFRLFQKGGNAVASMFHIYADIRDNLIRPDLVIIGYAIACPAKRDSAAAQNNMLSCLLCTVLFTIISMISFTILKLHMGLVLFLDKIC